MSKPVIVASLLAVILLILFCPSPIESVTKHNDVFVESLPIDINCEFQKLDATGRERKYYTFYSLLRGEKSKLILYARLLGLKEVNIEQFTGTVYIVNEPFKKWKPPCRNEINGVMFFECSGGDLSFTNEDPFKIQAKIKGDQMYLVKIGTIKCLRASLKEKGGLYVLL